MSKEQSQPSQSDGVSDSPQYKYWAFISYSHRDRKWGEWLHRALETYRVPKRLVGSPSRDGAVPERIYPLFIDRAELPVAADLQENVKQALAQSRYLIVVCSPNAASSRWVNEEVRAFKAMGRENRILCLIVDGEPNASGKPQLNLAECFPEALRFRVERDGRLTDERTEPIAADARRGLGSKRDAFLKLAAGVVGVDFGAIRLRDQERRVRQLAWFSTAMLCLVCVLAGLTYFALRQRRETMNAYSMSLTHRALALIDDGKSSDAAALLAEAVRLNQSNELAATRLGALLVQRSFPLPLIEPIGGVRGIRESRVHRMAICTNDSTVVVWSLDSLIPQDRPLILSRPIDDFSLSRGGNLLLTISGDRMSVWVCSTWQCILEAQVPRPSAAKIHAFLSPDDECLVSYFWNDGSDPQGPLRTWHLPTGVEGEVPLESEQTLSWPRFSPSGHRLALGSGGSVIMWSPVSRSIEWRSELGESVVQVTFSPDGRRLYVVCGQCSIATWGANWHYDGLWVLDAETGVPLLSPVRIENDYPQFSPDGRLLVLRSSVRDAATLTTIADLDPGDTSFFYWQFAPDGRRVVGRSRRGVGIVRDAMLGANVKELGRVGSGASLRFDDESGFVILLGEGGLLRILRSGTGEPVTEPAVLASSVWPIRYVERTRTLIAQMSDSTREGKYFSTLHAWSMIPPAQPLSVSPSRRVFAMPASPSGGKLAVLSCSRHGNPLDDTCKGIPGDSCDRAEIRDICSWKPSGPSIQRADGIGHVLWSPGESTMVLVSDKGLLAVYEVTTGSLVLELHNDAHPADWVDLSADGRWLAVASLDSTASLWDLQSGKQIWAAPKQSTFVSTARSLLDGQRFLLGSGSVLQLFDTRSGAIVRRVESQVGFSAVEVSPDDEKFLTVGEPVRDSYILQAWSATSGNLLWRPIVSVRWIAFVRFSADGRRVVVPSGDYGVEVLDALNGRPLSPPMVHSSEVSWAEFSPNGRYVVTQTNAQSVQLWDAETGQPVGGATTGEERRRYMSFSPDSRFFLTIVDSTVRIRHVMSGMLAADPLCNRGILASAWFSHDGRFVFARSVNGTARVWDVGFLYLRHRLDLANLANAVSGKELSRDGAVKSVVHQYALLQREKARSQRRDTASDLSRLSRWLLSAPATRTISPSFSISAHDYASELTAEGTRSSLETALDLDPGNALAIARYAKAFLSGSTVASGVDSALALFHSKRAVEKCSTEAEVWFCRAEILLKTGDLPEARVAANRALLLHPDDQLIRSHPELAAIFTGSAPH